jgi:hypothetical protein
MLSVGGILNFLCFLLFVLGIQDVLDVYLSSLDVRSSNPAPRGEPLFRRLWLEAQEFDR